MKNGDGTYDTITIDQKLERVVESESQYYIFKVHNELRNVNQRAYEPDIISIGPYHHHKSHLLRMEEQKLRFLKLLLQRKKENVSTYLDAMRPLEEAARKCYAEPINLSSDKFVEMMVLDGCFIIELLRKWEMPIDSAENNNDPLFRFDWILCCLQHDLMLFENQLPFFILTKLYEMVEGPGQEDKFISLALRIFTDLFPGRGRLITGVAQEGVKHLLHLIHIYWSSEKTKPSMNVRRNMDDTNLIRCSTELAEAGIKFEKIDDEVSFDIQFSNNGLLRIPVFTIEDRTESFLRNLMAYEQYCGDTDCNIVTDYMEFFSCLIKSDKDVAKLSRCGIIRSLVGDNAVVYGMFSKIDKCITAPTRNFHYGDIFERVNIYSKKRRNEWMAILKQKYMHSPWGIISILAASTILLLAFLQAVFQFLSWKDS